MLRKLFVITTLLVSLGACTKDFEKINVNPNTPAAVPLDYLLSESTLYIPGSAGDPGYKAWRANFIYASTVIQQMSSIEVTFYRGTVYTYQGDLSEAYFVNSTRIRSKTS